MGKIKYLKNGGDLETPKNKKRTATKSQTTTNYIDWADKVDLNVAPQNHEMKITAQDLNQIKWTIMSGIILHYKGEIKIFNNASDRSACLAKFNLTENQDYVILKDDAVIGIKDTESNGTITGKYEYIHSDMPYKGYAFGLKNMYNKDGSIEGRKHSLVSVGAGGTLYESENVYENQDYNTNSNSYTVYSPQPSTVDITPNGQIKVTELKWSYGAPSTATIKPRQYQFNAIKFLRDITANDYKKV